MTFEEWMKKNYGDMDVMETPFAKSILKDYKAKVLETIDRIDKEFKDDIKEKAKSGDFIINTMLVGANLHVTEQLKKELGLE